MPQLEAVDRVEALVIVDNLTASLSSNPAGVGTEECSRSAQRAGLTARSSSTIRCPTRRHSRTPART